MAESMSINNCTISGVNLGPISANRSVADLHVSDHLKFVDGTQLCFNAHFLSNGLLLSILGADHSTTIVCKTAMGATGPWTF